MRLQNSQDILLNLCLCPLSACLTGTHTHTHSLTCNDVKLSSSLVIVFARPCDAAGLCFVSIFVFCISVSSPQLIIICVCVWEAKFMVHCQTKASIFSITNDQPMDKRLFNYSLYGHWFSRPHDAIMQQTHLHCEIATWCHFGCVPYELLVGFWSLVQARMREKSWHPESPPCHSNTLPALIYITVGWKWIARHVWVIPKSLSHFLRLLLHDQLRKEIMCTS